MIRSGITYLGLENYVAKRWKQYSTIYRGYPRVKFFTGPDKCSLSHAKLSDV